MLQAAVRPVLLVQVVDDQFSFLFREIKHVEEAFRFCYHHQYLTLQMKTILQH